jgi:single-strand DNA-binding protein
MQRVTIIGHIGQDATVKDLGQNQVINFSVAVSESYVNKTTNEKVVNTTWYECAKWGNNTAVAQYLKKGTQVLVEGKPTARSWQKEDGSLISVLGVSVLNLELLGSAKSDNNATTNIPLHDSNNPTNVPSQNQQNPHASTFNPILESTTKIADTSNNGEEHDDLPF